MDGILIIDKPEGITSHDVVARCRRILRTKKIGHTGTLDPFATGVMVILVGKATRLAQFLDRDSKEYVATVRFGFETDTGDRTGTPREASIRDSAIQFSPTEIEDSLTQFRGEILQTPPMYSAKKVDGKKLYELARQGLEIERKPCKVNIYELELLTQESRRPTRDSALKTEDCSLRVLCSAGTYIRVLAEDIGRKVGVGAHLAELRRTKAGKFAIENSVTLEELEKLVAEERVAEKLVSMNDAIGHLVEIKLTETEFAKVKNGMKFQREIVAENDELLRLTNENELVAIARFDVAENLVQPKLVLLYNIAPVGVGLR